jgi:hypothetical protein
MHTPYPERVPSTNKGSTKANNLKKEEMFEYSVQTKMLVFQNIAYNSISM